MNSWDNLYTKFMILNIKSQFTCGESNLYWNTVTYKNYEQGRAVWLKSNRVFNVFSKFWQEFNCRFKYVTTWYFSYFNLCWCGVMQFISNPNQIQTHFTSIGGNLLSVTPGHLLDLTLQKTTNKKFWNNFLRTLNTQVIMVKMIKTDIKLKAIIFD